mgnify:CR=1 FL=1
MHKVRGIFWVSLILLVAISCGKFRKIEKSEDWRVKFEAALNYYEKKDYYRASVLFEQILPIVRGLPEGEKVQFYLAYCQYYDKLYLLASEQFRTFYETYGRSSLAQEARYMYAYSLYAASPGPNLDQTSSMEAMAAMQEFINRYPDSKFTEQAIEVIRVSQIKLEEKGFENARQYHKMRQYKAAVVALNNFRSNFPDSQYLEEAQFLIIESEFMIAEKSFQNKQADRYKAVVDHYQEFIDEYPNSRFLRDAEKYYAESLDQLKTLKNTNS